MPSNKVTTSKSLWLLVYLKKSKDQIQDFFSEFHLLLKESMH